MRLCKGIGIGIELWRPSFVRAWKEKYAEPYQDRGKTRWRRKDREPEQEEEREESGSGGNGQTTRNVESVKSSATTRPAPVTVTITLSDGTVVTEPLTAIYHRFEALKKHLGEAAYRAVLGEHGYENKSQIKVCDIPKVFANLILIAAGPIPMKEKK
jgi:hypothetical protein